MWKHSIAPQSALRWCCENRDFLEAKKGGTWINESYVANCPTQSVPQYSISSTISALARLQLLYSASARTQMVHMTVRCQDFSFCCNHYVLPTLCKGSATHATLIARTYSMTYATSQLQVERRLCKDHSTSSRDDAGIIQYYWQTYYQFTDRVFDALLPVLIVLIIVYRRCDSKTSSLPYFASSIAFRVPPIVLQKVINNFAMHAAQPNQKLPLYFLHSYQFLIVSLIENQVTLNVTI